MNARRHLAWFDREDVLRTLGDDAAYLEDKLHRQESFHVLMAQRMIETLAPVFATRESGARLG